MARFLIEFRLHGYAREYAKWARARILLEARRLGVGRIREKRFVPHITLFGGAEAHNLRDVIREVERVGQKYSRVPFKLGVKRGEFQVEDANWLYLDIQPSPELEQFRYELAQGLLGLEKKIYDTCKPYDRKPKYKFHCSVGKYNPRDSAKFEKLAEYAETKCSLEAFEQRKVSLFGKLLNIIERYILRAEEEDPGISQHLLRVTVLGRGSRIQADYDLVLGRMLSRKQALSRYWWGKTIEKFRELQGSPREEYLSVADKSVYFIADAHFDHKNIIKYCHRPFSSVAEMNQAMKNNWNNTVGDNGIVYFVGDWSFGRRSRPPAYWKGRMKGNIVSIRGSHDREVGGIQFRDFEELHVNGYDFLLIHNPNPNDKRQTEKQKQKLQNWRGWVIHGHVHNNEMDKYPFINGERKTINVGVELINYKPVSLEYLLSLDLGSIKRMRTIDSPPERW
jgi:calcineurin-like phosphoesterase family protein/2'-5' RNA ligase